ncbi:MAG TPA: DUF6544 family protein, partial [Gemmatimonadales bacterium]|nr:DUF6544 family protein [Gemmatimonadales bacterium]
STELAVGELMRFLAEAVWYPTVLAPGHGVQWTPAGDQSAQAILTDGEASAALRFTFGESGLVQSVSTEARPRAVKGEFIPTAWEGRFWDYRRVEGMTIPHSGEVAWVIQGERRPYWRGEVEDVGYTFAE